MKNKEIIVKVHSYGPDRPLSLVYIDPTSGKKKAKSSGTTRWGEAERLAGELEKELRAGRFAPPSKTTWAEFVRRYTEEKLSERRPSSRRSSLDSLGLLATMFEPDKLAKVNAALLSRFASELRKGRTIRGKDGKPDKVRKVKDTTIAHHLRHIKAALRWAERMGILAKAPAVEMPKTAKGQSLARSRAVTTEEYERMLAAVVKVRPDDAQAWERLLTGVWLSGLRLGEAAVLSWDEGAGFSVDLIGRRPVFRILAEAQKSTRDEVLPMTPDFAEFLLRTPEAARKGLVFPLIDQQTQEPLTRRRIGVVVGSIGRKAGVVTNKAAGKYAGLHDLRRAFCTRWASKVMPPVLRRLARHANIQTTLSYYVDLDAEAIADDLWAKHPAAGELERNGNTSGNISPVSAESTVAPEESRRA
jgi:site-specific recombinase XerD